MKKILTFALALIVFTPYAMHTAAADAFQISVLSSRPDMITGGDALVSIQTPSGEPLEKVRVELNGKNVAADLHRDASTHMLTGLVSGLKTGENSLKVFSGGGTQPAATAALKNYPITGPVFSGPQEQPFLCQTQEFK